MSRSPSATTPRRWRPPPSSPRARTNSPPASAAPPSSTACSPSRTSRSPVRSTRSARPGTPCRRRIIAASPTSIASCAPVRPRLWRQEQPMFRSVMGRNQDLFLVGAVLAILLVLFSPIPPVLLDLLLITNFAFALTVLLLTFYVLRPVEFSTFPSLLLVGTLFRLSLNVAATRLILTGGRAGDVIASIGQFAVQGQFVVGLVVFFILIVVQYVVVTAGAQRVSEVAARFTLDSMPGQQMSIDADLNMGLIDQKEAVRRRSELEKEASFYGAMDGASKFVKGNAVAGIIIVLINIIAGWTIGVLEMGMPWHEALERFTLLTIGDGIATQLPALVISVATGIIVTRSSSDRELGTEVLKQLSSVPRIP